MAEYVKCLILWLVAIVKCFPWWLLAVLCLCAIPYFSMCGAADVQADRQQAVWDVAKGGGR